MYNPILYSLFITLWLGYSNLSVAEQTVDLAGSDNANTDNADPMRPPRLFMPPQPVVTPVEPESKTKITKKAKSVLVVNAIRLQPNNSYALINQRKVRPGDTINGAKVVAIHEHGVTIVQGNRRSTLPFTPSTVKTIVRTEP